MFRGGNPPCHCVIFDAVRSFRRMKGERNTAYWDIKQWQTARQAVSTRDDAHTDSASQSMKSVRELSFWANEGSAKIRTRFT